MTTDQATQTLNPRTAEVFLDVVGSVADVIRTRRVTFEEFREAIGFLEDVVKEGELPLLMDVFLGVAVDDVNYAANGGTESNLEGPFYIPDAPILQAPYALPRRDNEPGETLFMSGTVAGLDGSPLAGAMLDVWQANGAGEYSHFHPGVPDFNLRGRFTTDSEGRFEVRTVVPSAYEIPKNGPDRPPPDRPWAPLLPSFTSPLQAIASRLPFPDHPDLLRGGRISPLRCGRRG